MGGNDFLTKFPEAERIHLLSKAKYRAGSCGEVIFHQGELVDSMYVVLQGAVGVRLRDGSFGGEPTIVCTIREGQQLGELGALSAGPKQQANRRKASCVCLNEVHLLQFPSAAVQQVVACLIHETYKDDIAFLQHVNYFEVPPLIASSI